MLQTSQFSVSVVGFSSQCGQLFLSPYKFLLSFFDLMPFFNEFREKNLGKGDESIFVFDYLTKLCMLLCPSHLNLLMITPALCHSLPLSVYKLPGFMSFFRSSSLFYLCIHVCYVLLKEMQEELGKFLEKTNAVIAGAHMRPFLERKHKNYQLQTPIRKQSD